MIYVWSLGLVMFAIAEAVTVAPVAFWFCGGCGAALIAECFDYNITIQVISFSVASVVIAFLFAPFFKKFKNEIQPTNANSFVQQYGIVTKEIGPNSPGQVNMSGTIWSAVSADGLTILEGDKVVSVNIDGVKLVVIPTENKNKED